MFKSIKEFLFGKPVEAPKAEEVPYKVEAPVNPQITDAVTQSPAWHTAPSADTKPITVTSTLDVNHDGKVNFDDVKEVVKKTRTRKPAAAKPAAPKKPAAMKATAKKGGRKPKAQS